VTDEVRPTTSGRFQRAATGLERLDLELRSEAAAALGRIGSRLETLLGELRRMREGEVETSEQVAGAPDLAAYEALRAQARRYRWYLEVQREALGLRSHADVDRFYPIPPPLGPERS
jgi:hypothetical protein